MSLLGCFFQGHKTDKTHWDALFAQVVIFEVEQAKPVVEVIDKGVDAGGPRHVAHGDTVGGQPRLGRTRAFWQAQKSRRTWGFVTLRHNWHTNQLGRQACDAVEEILEINVEALLGRFGRWCKAKAKRGIQRLKQHASIKVQRNSEQNGPSLTTLWHLTAQEPLKCFKGDERLVLQVDEQGREEGVLLGDVAPLVVVSGGGVMKQSCDTR